MSQEFIFSRFGTWQNNTGKQVQPIDLRPRQQNSAPSGSSRPNIGASGISLPKTAWPIHIKTAKVPPPSKFKQQSAQQSAQRSPQQSVQQSTQQSAQQYSNMIISSGDCSDFDGFLALPIYYKAEFETDANVYFMMTYPSYLDPNNQIAKDIDTYESSNPGLGYNYGFNVLKTYWKTICDNKQQKEQYNQYHDLINIITSYLKVSWEQLNFKHYKYGMDKIAMDIITIIWDWCSEEIFPNKTAPKIYLIDGGYNKINPFNYTSIKNEVYVYGKPLLDIKKEVVITNYCTKLRSDGFIGHCNSCTKIFMDMNGSMAWYDTKIQACLETNSQKMKCCVVMGGVEPEISIDTMSSVPGFINRFSTATMNQLYHPENTEAFFSKFADKCIFVTNNAINKYFNWGVLRNPHNGRKNWLLEKIGINDEAYVTYGMNDKTIPPTLPINFKNDIQKMFNVMFDMQEFNERMHMLFDAFYTKDRLADRKPFDMISAYVLYNCMMNQTINYVTKTLYFNPQYGITILSNTNIDSLYYKPENNNNSNNSNNSKIEKQVESNYVYKHLTNPNALGSQQMKDAMVIEYKKTIQLINDNDKFLIFENVIIPTDKSFADLSRKVYSSNQQQNTQQGGKGHQKRKKKSPVKYTKTGETYTDSKGVSRVLYEKKSSKGIMNSYVKMKNPTTKKFQYKKIS
jgi:hypothetical protein